MRLRPFVKEDAKIISTWISDEQEMYKWCADILGNYPMTPQKLIQHYDSHNATPCFMVFTACEDNLQPEGQLILRYTDDSNSTVRLGLIIVDNKLRGKGIGKQMLSLACDYAFNFLNAKKVTLGVFENNPGAVNCYKSVGFEICGEGKYPIGNELWNCFEMELHK